MYIYIYIYTHTYTNRDPAGAQHCPRKRRGPPGLREGPAPREIGMMIMSFVLMIVLILIMLMISILVVVIIILIVIIMDRLFSPGLREGACICNSLWGLAF